MSSLKATRSVFGLHSLTRVQGWGSSRIRGLNLESVLLAQPAKRAQLGKGGFLRLVCKERWSPFWFLWLQGLRERLRALKATARASGGRNWAEDCHLWAERGEVR